MDVKEKPRRRESKHRRSRESSHSRKDSAHKDSVHTAEDQNAVCFLPKSQRTVSSASGEPIQRRVKSYCKQPSSVTTSHTHFYRETIDDPRFMKKITRAEYLGIEDSISGSSETYQCEHVPEGRKYTEKTLLKRNLLKNLDPRPDVGGCDELIYRRSQEISKILSLLSVEKTGPRQVERWKDTLNEYCTVTEKGYTIIELDDLCLVLDYLGDHLHSQPFFKSYFTCLLRNLGQPIHLTSGDDILTYFNSLRSFFTFMDYLLCVTMDDGDFDLVSKAMIWHLSAPNSSRGRADVKLGQSLAAATTTYQTVARMFAVVPDYRFYAFLKLAIILAFASDENCLKLVRENIFENIFYRLNPYFPNEKLSASEISLPSSNIMYTLAITRHLSEFISLIFVLVRTLSEFLKVNPQGRKTLPCPDEDAQICFAWMYRLECRTATHRHHRNMLTVIVMGLLDIYGEELVTFSHNIMRDVMTMSVMSELPRRQDWYGTIPFNAGQQDTQFKGLLIMLSVKFLQTFPRNVCMMISLHWVLGLMYLVDPGLSSLRMKWSPQLFAQIRKTSLQALILTIPLSPFNLVQDYGLIKRILWYIEWYPENPFELSTLYWCLRLLETSLYRRTRPERQVSAKTMLDTHGLIVVANLSKVLLCQGYPLIERCQGIINICLRIITSVIELDQKVTCVVYPHLAWPSSVNDLALLMIDTVSFSLSVDKYISDRWLISLLNLVWESIIWKTESRQQFVKRDGVYKLLDIITKASSPVQCITLAIICDIARAGEAVSHLITWRAKTSASYTYPPLVKAGSTIVTLLAAVFRDECRENGVSLTEDGVAKDTEMPLRPKDYYVEPELRVGEENLRTSPCLAAASLAGSRMSKAFAILHMLSNDLEHKVQLLDEAYHLYHSVVLTPEDEVILILCSHYLTLKLNETWSETYIKNKLFLPEDNDIVEEFMEIVRGWGEEIQRQQNDALERINKSELDKENSLYNFLSRVRLNMALDALRTIRQVARSSDREKLMHAMLHDAVGALQNRTTTGDSIGATVHKTYAPALDGQNITGQHIKLPTLAPPYERFVPSTDNTLSPCSLKKIKSYVGLNVSRAKIHK